MTPLATGAATGDVAEWLDKAAGCSTLTGFGVWDILTPPDILVAMASAGPRAVQIDASSHCQLACPLCPTADGRARPVLGAGHLKVADFEAMLDGTPELMEVELSNYGEMFLNPYLPELLEAAYRRKVVVSGNNGVNLNFAREEALEAVVRYRVRALTCSIDGASQETYSLYRKNGNLDKVLSNIDRILEYKRRYRTAFPMLYWQFVVFGHNEHELNTARQMAASRGMEFVPRLSWDADHSPVGKPELVRIETGLGAANREEYKEKKGVDYTRDICSQLWHAPVVNWDGKLLGCCVNYWGDFGANVFTEGLRSSTQNSKMDRARKMLTGEEPADPEIPCSTCHQFESFRDSGQWLTAEEIESNVRPRYIVSIMPVAVEGTRFAQIGVVSADIRESKGTMPKFGVSGRIFRFGIDSAVFCTVPSPGEYRAEARALTSGGWRLLTFGFTVHERPVCQELVMNFKDSEPAKREDEGGVEFNWLPSWIS